MSRYHSTSLTQVSVLHLGYLVIRELCLCLYRSSTLNKTHPSQDGHSPWSTKLYVASIFQKGRFFPHCNDTFSSSKNTYRSASFPESFDVQLNIIVKFSQQKRTAASLGSFTCGTRSCYETPSLFFLSSSKYFLNSLTVL